MSSLGSPLITLHNNNSQVRNRTCLDGSVPRHPPPLVSPPLPAFFGICPHTCRLTLQWLLLLSNLLCITMGTTFPKSHHTMLPEPSTALRSLEVHTPWLSVADATLLLTPLIPGAPVFLLGNFFLLPGQTHDMCTLKHSIHRITSCPHHAPLCIGPEMVRCLSWVSQRLCWLTFANLIQTKVTWEEEASIRWAVSVSAGHLID